MKKKNSNSLDYCYCQLLLNHPFSPELLQIGLHSGRTFRIIESGLNRPDALAVSRDVKESLVQGTESHPFMTHKLTFEGSDARTGCYASAVTILKIDFEVMTLARIECRIEWTILLNQTIDFHCKH